MAFFQSASLRSKDTPIILRPLLWYLLYTLTTLGFSTLQGLHQAAQKSIIVTLPMACLSDISPPSGVGPEKSGATAPIAVFFTLSSRSFSAFKFSIIFLAGAVSLISA